MSRIDELRAELALAEVEAELSAAKAAINTPEIAELRNKARKAQTELRNALAAAGDLTPLKDAVRAARQAHREARAANAPPPVAVDEEVDG